MSKTREKLLKEIAHAERIYLLARDPPREKERHRLDLEDLKRELNIMDKSPR